jgi:hypothetical protein
MGFQSEGSQIVFQQMDIEALESSVDLIVMKTLLWSGIQIYSSLYAANMNLKL